MSSTAGAERLREEVRERYAAAARTVTDGTGSGCCGGGSCCDDSFGEKAVKPAGSAEPIPVVAAKSGCC
jgi:hypothetical protein